MNNYRISSGKGQSQYRLVAFDNALIDAGISDYNLVRVSSILPSGSKRQHHVDVPIGSPLHTAYATMSSDIKGKKIATAIAVGIPKDGKDIGVIMEAEGEDAEQTEEVARDMVMEAMSNHGIEIDHIESSSIDGIVEEGYLSLVSAIALW